MTHEMDDWLRANAHRKRLRLADLDRHPEPTALTNDRRAFTERLLEEWAAIPDTTNETETDK